MALSVVDRIRKRAFYPLTLVNGEKVHLRALTHGQKASAIEHKDKDASIGYVIGCGLLQDDGTPEYTPTQGESVEQFGERVFEDTKDIGKDVQHQIVAKIFELTNEPEKSKAEAIIKN